MRPFAARVINGVRRRLLPVPRQRGTSLTHDIRAFLDVNSVRGVLDVGANTGQSALFFNRLFPSAQIVSVEPVSSVFQQLVVNTRSLPRVRCVRAAVGASEGSATINTFEISQLGSIGCASDASGTEMVPLRTLPTIVREVGLPAVDFLKIDVEGYELQVLEGAAPLLGSAGAPLLLVEAGLDDTNPRFTSAWRLSAALNQYGYEVFGFYEQASWEQHGALLYMNVLFVSKAMRDAVGRLPRGGRVALPLQQN